PRGPRFTAAVHPGRSVVATSNVISPRSPTTRIVGMLGQSALAIQQSGRVERRRSMLDPAVVEAGTVRGVLRQARGPGLAAVLRLQDGAESADDPPVVVIEEVDATEPGEE